MIQKLTIPLVMVFMISCGEKKAKEELKEESSVIDSEVKVWTANLFYEDKNELGEGAIWNDETGELWSVDIEGKKWLQLDVSTKEQTVHELDQRIGTIVPTNDERAVLALESGVYFYDLVTRKQELLVIPTTHSDDLRFNDGKCDPKGRLWVGSMHLDQIEDKAFLYNVSSNGESNQVLNSITISNGITWSLDGKTMYYIDTPDGKIRVFDFDVENGTITNERSLMDFAGYGYPDGSTMDEEDHLWVCLWNGNGVLRVDTQTGKVIGKIEVPAHNVTSCAFGGQNLDSLFITTARVDMTPEELDSLPLSGSIFVSVPGVQGVKANFFKEI